MEKQLRVPHEELCSPMCTCVYMRDNMNSNWFVQKAFASPMIFDLYSLKSSCPHLRGTYREVQRGSRWSKVTHQMSSHPGYKF